MTQTKQTTPALVHGSAPDPSTDAIPVLQLLDRDRSLLAFNARVLDMATRAEVPLLERLRYVCIVSSNLDEFFEVRFAPHLSALRLDGHAATKTRAVSDAAHELVAKQYQIYNDILLPEFARQGIHVLSHGERNEAAGLEHKGQAKGERLRRARDCL
jgi:polyphosphate kinase